MSKKANPTLIGGFVVGAAALAVAGILVLGSGKFLVDESEYVLYFDRSVRGLDIGAPVVFRGVPIGRVSKIEAHWAPDDKDIRIPVYVKLLRGQIKGAEKDASRYTPEEFLERLINEWGLRGQLVMDSLVTGKLFVALDFLPETPKNLRGDGTVEEIPTAPTEVEQLTKKIENLRIDELVANANKTIETLNELLKSDDVQGILASLHQGLDDLAKVVKKVDAEIEPLSKSAKDALNQGRDTLASSDKFIQGDLTKLVQDADGALEPLSKSAEDALGQASKALASANAILSNRSGLRLELGTLLEELASAARSIRVLAQYLERHPEALIRGKEL